MRIIRIAVILIAVACIPLLSHAAEGKVTSSTQYLWYQDFLSEDKDQSDVAQYLRLNVTKLDKEGKINVYGYGRVIKQLSTSVEAVSYTHLRAHETRHDLVCRLLLEKKKKQTKKTKKK